MPKYNLEKGRFTDDFARFFDKNGLHVVNDDNIGVCCQ